MALNPFEYVRGAALTDELATIGRTDGTVSGIAYLVNGHATIANPAVTETSRVFPAIQDANGGDPGALYVSALDPGVGFSIASTSATDQSLVSYLIVTNGTSADAMYPGTGTSPMMLLPDKVLASYYPGWVEGLGIDGVSTDYNQIYIFNAEPVPTGNGAFFFPYHANVPTADIEAVRARGQRVVLVMGGAGAGFDFESRTQSQNLVDSFQEIVGTLGTTIDGVDLNNFEVGVGSAAGEMVWIATRLKSIYGAGFTVTCTPAAGGDYAPQDRVIALALKEAGVLDYAAPQLYDNPDLITVAAMEDLTGEWVTLLGDASKVAMGLGANHAGGSTTADSETAFGTVLAAHPTIRGVTGWSAEDEAAEDWSFAAAMKPLVLP